MVTDQASLGDIIKIFLRHIRPYRASAFLIVLGIIISESLNIISPWFYKSLFDTLATGSPTEAATIHALLRLVTIIIGLRAGSWIFYRLVNWFNSIVQPKIMVDLERTSFSYILDHSYRFFANNFTGSLVRKVQRISRAFEDLSDNVIRQFLPLLIIITGSMIALWQRSRMIALATFAWIVLFVLANYLISIWKLKYDIKRAAKDSEATGAMADALTNNITIKLFANQDFERKIFQRLTEEYRKLRTLTWNLAEINDAVQWGLIIVIEFVVLYAAVKLWGRGLLTIGDFALLQGYLLALFNQIWNLGRIIRRTYESMADAKEMVAILNTPHEIKDSSQAKILKVKNGAITFKNVKFGYRANHLVLDKFNLTIAPREKVALVGPSGAGKSTVTKLLLRFHDINSGQIKIDDFDISKVTQESLRQNIAVVPQEPTLFHRSLLENIRYGRLQAADEEVIAAAQKARCHHFIERLPDGYGTLVGERGIKLSSGERQRVAIARAILKNAPILLLDEATSSLDSESEALIQEALTELMQSKTAVAIAHRLSTILKMDRIVVIDKNRVVDAGTHAELMEKDGLYRKLWQIQSSGFIE